MSFNKFFTCIVFLLLSAVSSTIYSFGLLDRASNAAHSAIEGAADIADRSVDTAADVTDDVVGPHEVYGDVVYERPAVRGIISEEPAIIHTTETVPVVVTPVGTQAVVAPGGVIVTPALDTAAVVEPSIK